MKSSFLLLLGSLTLPACAGAELSSAWPGPTLERSPLSVEDASLAVELGDARGSSAVLGGELEQSAAPATSPPAQAVVPQRLIRTGLISAAVDDYGPFEADLSDWLGEAGGYVSDLRLSHYEGEVSWATLTVRVPAERFDTLVTWTEEEVRVNSLSLETTDVTEQWVDVEARIENSRRTEAELVELLDQDTDSLADVLAVERELSRVRGEIEASEGQMRVLRDRVGMSTLTYEIQVDRPYEALVSIPFGERVADTFAGSLSAMASVGRGLVLAGVALSPWLTLAALSLWALVGLVRLGRRRRAVVA